MQITDHFSDTELGVSGQEQRLIDNAKYLCEQVLEPIRLHFNRPVMVHCGYRDEAHNLRVGGKPDSYHLFQGGHAAADIHVVGVSIPALFDWLRLESKLLFDKVIMERSHGVPVVLHIQVDRLHRPRREAYIGDTGDCHHYTQVEVR